MIIGRGVNVQVERRQGLRERVKSGGRPIGNLLDGQRVRISAHEKRQTTII